MGVSTDDIREQFRPPTNTLFLHAKQMEVFNDRRRFKVVVAGRRWGKCLHTGSMIEMADGTQKPIEQIAPGDMVLTANENTYKVQSRRVNAVESNGIKETVVIKTAGRSLRSTPHHPILANNTWIKAGDLKVGDLVAVPKRLALGTSTLPDHVVDMLSIWLAEGHNYIISNTTPEIIDVVRQSAAAFGGNLKVASIDGIDWTVSSGDRSGGPQAGSKNPMRLMLEGFGLWGKNSKTKFIPNEVFALNESQLARFLNLFFACDGCICKRAGNTWAIEVGLANEQMTRQVASLLHKFGIRTQIKHKVHAKCSSVTGNAFESWRLIASDSASIICFATRIGALSKKEAVNEALSAALQSAGSCNSYLPISHDDFVGHLSYVPKETGKYGGYNFAVARDLPEELRQGLTSWRKQTPARTSERRYRALSGFSDGFFDPIANGDLAWEEVTSVETADPAQTWDLSIEDNHNFIANGVVVHNTALSRICLIKFARKPKRLIWYVAPSYRMAKQIMWPELVESLPRSWVRKYNETILTITLVNGSRIELKGADNPDCYDEQTEILTETGWVGFADLPKTDRVLTLNPETLNAEWKQPYKYVDQEYEGPMYRIASGKLDLLVTPEHKFLVKNRKGITKFRPIEEISEYQDRIPARCGWDGVDIPEMTLDKCAIAGFYLAEGCAYGVAGGDRTNRGWPVFFSQTKGVKGGLKGDVREQFSKILTRAGYKFRDTKIGMAVQNKELYDLLFPLGNKYTKRIPREWLDLPQNKLRVMLHWLVMGDGNWREGDVQYYSVSRGLADDVQELAIKAGYSALIVEKKQTDCEIDGRVISATTPLWEVKIHHNEFNHFRDSKESYISHEEYKGRVYCVGVENHVVMVRRNGKICWSGNTLRGVGVHYLVMDEVQDITPDAWKKVLRPTLASTGGHALFIGCVSGKTKVLKQTGAVKIETLSRASADKTLDPLDLDLYGLDRTFHRANGFWNNGMVKTKKIKTQMGFEIESSLPHPIWVMATDGTQGWKKTEDICVGDRVAIARGMEVWGNEDPLSGWDTHAENWRKQFEGKQGPKPTRIEIE